MIPPSTVRSLLAVQFVLHIRIAEVTCILSRLPWFQFLHSGLKVPILWCDGSFRSNHDGMFVQNIVCTVSVPNMTAESSR